MSLHRHVTAFSLRHAVQYACTVVPGHVEWTVREKVCVLPFRPFGFWTISDLTRQRRGPNCPPTARLSWPQTRTSLASSVEIAVVLGPRTESGVRAPGLPIMYPSSSGLRLFLSCLIPLEIIIRQPYRPRRVKEARTEFL